MRPEYVSIQAIQEKKKSLSRLKDGISSSSKSFLPLLGVKYMTTMLFPLDLVVSPMLILKHDMCVKLSCFSPFLLLYTAGQEVLSI
jgi:hypothetical protein